MAGGPAHRLLRLRRRPSAVGGPPPSRALRAGRGRRLGGEGLAAALAGAGAVPLTGEERAEAVDDLVRPAELLD
ncbi:hypothetical protein ABZ618_20940 [Streptomyces roseolus]|uniref:hypothetical protein n=1 Tax=Streptomyces roseolus TaxID=67358 RepID=UPI00340AFF95